MSLPLVGAAVAPDVDVVFAHGGDQHGAGHGAAKGRGVEVGLSGGGDMEGAALQRRQTLRDQLGAALDEARLLGAIAHGLARNLVVVSLVGLPQVRRIGERHGPLRAHPVQRRAGIETA
jgi:hypothetical protein